MKKFIFFIFFIFILNADPQLSQSEYIWNTGLAMEADVRPDSFYDLFIDPRTYINPKKINDGDIIWIQPDYLSIFTRNILPQIRKKIILLINASDLSFPDCIKSQNEKEALLESDKIIHIFAQNCTLSDHYKVTQIPIGLDYHTLAFGKKAFGENKISVTDQELRLKYFSKIGEKKSRSLQACADFHFNDTMRCSNHLDLIFGEDRTAIYNFLKNKKEVVFFKSKVPRTQLWFQKMQYSFSICAPGNGFDTHRVWEDLILGLIPIVKTSPLDPLYKNFPIIIVKDWNEINLQNLILWKKQNGERVYSEKIKAKLSQDYWLKLIRSYKDIL